MGNIWSGRGGWTLGRDFDRLTLTAGGKVEVFAEADAGRLSVTAGVFRGTHPRYAEVHGDQPSPPQGKASPRIPELASDLR